MITDFSGIYLNFESTTDGEIVEILNEGKVEYNETLRKEMFNILVKKGDKEMTYSPNNKAGKILQKAYGVDSKKWVGRKVQLMHVEGKMMIRPITEDKV